MLCEIMTSMIQSNVLRVNLEPVSSSYLSPSESCLRIPPESVVSTTKWLKNMTFSDAHYLESIKLEAFSAFSHTC